MLVFTRQKGEQIIINDDITITIVSFVNGKVRVGIEAPKSIPVHRKEVHDAINKEASGTTKP